MARRPRRRQRPEPHRELSISALGGIRHSEVGPGGESYQVQVVRGKSKSYRCPGCNQIIAPNVSHVVSWREESLLGWESGVDARRHWHKACWDRGVFG